MFYIGYFSLQERPEKPDKSWLSVNTWNAAYDLHETLPAFKGIYRDLPVTPCWIRMGEHLVRDLLSIFFFANYNVNGVPINCL